MGDMSAEPSMEDILASIKRVIKEGEAPPPRRMSPRPAPVAVEREEEEVLELDQPMLPPARAAAEPVPAPPPIPSQGAPSETVPSQAAPPPSFGQPQQVAAPPPAPPAASAAPSAAGVSPATAEAARGALDQLSRLVVKPETGGDGTLEGLVRDMLRPMLSDWLDAHLPRLVEEMVSREIAKITAGPR